MKPYRGMLFHCVVLDTLPSTTVFTGLQFLGWVGGWVIELVGSYRSQHSTLFCAVGLRAALRIHCGVQVSLGYGTPLHSQQGTYMYAEFKDG